MASAKKEAAHKQLIAKLNKKYGKTVIATADQIPDVYHLRRPSGIMQLDIDTAGGLPAGTVNYLSGPEGSGKTDLLYRYMAQQQRYYGEKCNLALAPVEHPLDHFRLRRVGVKVPVPKERIEAEQQARKDMGLPPLTKEEVADLSTGIGNFYSFKCDTMEDTMGALLEIIEDGSFNMVGVDSLTAMIPEAIADKELDEDARRGAHAMCVTKFYQKYYPLASRLDGDPALTTVVFTQQVRANEKKASAPSYLQKYLPDFATAGAYAGRHGKCFDILISNGERKKEKGTNSGRDVISKMMKWELVKGKAGSHEGIYGDVEFNFRTANNIDYPATVFVAGVQRGILQESQGLITWIHNGAVEPSVDRMPLADFVQHLEQDVELDYLIRRDILYASGITCRYV